MSLAVFDAQTCLVDTIYIKCHVIVRRDFGLSYTPMEKQFICFSQCMVFKVSSVT